MTFGGITFFGVFFGTVFVSGSDFDRMSVCVVISVGPVTGALVVVEKSVAVIMIDVGLFVVLSPSGSVLLSMSGAGRGKG